MNSALSLLAVLVAGHLFRSRYQQAHIVLLANHLSKLQLERHMEALTADYARAIASDDEARQNQIFELCAPGEEAFATQLQALANSMQNENLQDCSMGVLAICIPYLERIAPALTRDFRQLLHIHANGVRQVVDNSQGLDLKSRAYHLSAELYLFQHSCHWYCKSKLVADARLMQRHQVSHQKVLESVSGQTRQAYERWLKGNTP